MTREEATKLLTQYIDYDAETPDYYEMEEACKVAINALEKQPCEDAISRQAVLALPTSKTRTLSGEIVEEEVDIKLIKALPPVTPKEKTGRWREDANKIDAQFGRHTYICSECGKYAEYFISGTEVWWDRIKPNYCPNCGCRMRGDSNGNE